MKDNLSLKHIHEQTEDICLTAINQNYHALLYVQDQTELLCIAAININPLAIEYIRDQTEELCLLAIDNVPAINLYTLYTHLSISNERIDLRMVQKHCEMITRVNYQTYEICEAAVKQNGFMIDFIKSEFITTELCAMAMFNDKFMAHWGKEYITKLDRIKCLHNRKAIEICSTFLNTDIRSLRTKRAKS